MFLFSFVNTFSYCVHRSLGEDQFSEWIVGCQFVIVLKLLPFDENPLEEVGMLVSVIGNGLFVR